MMNGYKYENFCQKSWKVRDQNLKTKKRQEISLSLPYIRFQFVFIYLNLKSLFTYLSLYVVHTMYTMA